MKKIVIYMLVVIVIIGLGIMVGLKLKGDNNKSQETLGKAESEVYNKEQNVIENTEKTDENTNENIENAEQEQQEQEETKPKTDLEKAIEIAKKEWGIEDGVKFELEETTKAGEYIICVREISTTNALIWYKINVGANTCEEW